MTAHKHLKQLIRARAHWFAEAQNHRDLLGRHGKNPGTKEHDHQNHHDDLDNGKAALQRFGQRLRSRVFGRDRCRRPMVMIVVVMVMTLLVLGMIVVVAHDKIKTATFWPALPVWRSTN